MPKIVFLASFVSNFNLYQATYAYDDQPILCNIAFFHSKRKEKILRYSFPFEILWFGLLIRKYLTLAVLNLKSEFSNLTSSLRNITPGFKNLTLDLRNVPLNF